MPFMYAVLWFCIFRAVGIGMNLRAIWLENMGTTTMRTTTSTRTRAFGHAVQAATSMCRRASPARPSWLIAGTST